MLFTCKVWNSDSLYFVDPEKSRLLKKSPHPIAQSITQIAQFDAPQPQLYWGKTEIKSVWHCIDYGTLVLSFNKRVFMLCPIITFRDTWSAHESGRLRRLTNSTVSNQQLNYQHRTSLIHQQQQLQPQPWEISTWNRGQRLLTPGVPQARFPFKRNRLRWQVANHGCHCFDRAFLLAGTCVCCVKISRNKRKLQERKWMLSQ